MLGYKQICLICYEPFSRLISCAIHAHLSHDMHYIYSTATVSHTLDLIIKYGDTCIQFDRQLKTSSDLIEYLADSKHELHDRDRLISIFLCSINKFDYRTKHFFKFKSHLISMHIVTHLTQLIKLLK
ncbi:unnamed protein product [Rotaria magnacalcarata]